MAITEDRVDQTVSLADLLRRVESLEADHAAQVKKKAEKNAPVPPKEPETRTPFTVEDEQAAIIPGIADARARGDSETEFAHLLPQASGPWLALSGGGADGAYGAGVLTGWSQAGNRPEFAVVTGVRDPVVEPSPS